MKEEPTQMVLHQIVHMSQHQCMNLLEIYDLKPWQAGILFTLSAKGGLSQRELAKKTRVTPPTMTVAIKKMEKQGYIKREPDGNDQRIIRLSITDVGEKRISEVKGVFQVLEEMTFQGMSVEERLLLKRLLKQMRDNLAQNLTGSEAEICHHHIE